MIIFIYSLIAIQAIIHFTLAYSYIEVYEDGPAFINAILLFIDFLFFFTLLVFHPL